MTAGPGPAPGVGRGVFCRPLRKRNRSAQAQLLHRRVDRRFHRRPGWLRGLLHPLRRRGVLQLFQGRVSGGAAGAGRQPLGIDHLENERFDTIIQGRRGYDLALEIGITSPYAHMRQLVASRTLTSADPAVEIVAGDVAARIRELKREDGLGIYLCGRANLAAQLIDEVDELVIKSYPLVLGSGIAHVRHGVRPYRLRAGVQPRLRQRSRRQDVQPQAVTHAAAERPVPLQSAP